MLLVYKYTINRDLKPENLLMTGREDSSDLKLVDFGFAAKVEGFSLTNQCGTPAYVAPEIIRKQPHGEDCCCCKSTFDMPAF